MTCLDKKKCTNIRWFLEYFWKKRPIWRVLLKFKRRYQWHKSHCWFSRKTDTEKIAGGVQFAFKSFDNLILNSTDSSSRTSVAFYTLKCFFCVCSGKSFCQWNCQGLTKLAFRNSCTEIDFLEFPSSNGYACFNISWSPVSCIDYKTSTGNLKCFECSFVNCLKIKL